MKRRRSELAITLTAMLILASSCKSFPPEPLRKPAAPANWSAKFSKVSGTPQNWLDDFKAPRLRELVELALDSNNNLHAISARVKAARARARMAGAPLLPSANIGLDASRSRRNITGSSTTRSRTVSNFGMDATISWEADLWGRLGNAASAATSDAAIADEDYRGARLLLASDVARNWFTAIETRLQTTLAEQTVDSFSRTLKIIEERYRLGLNTALDVRLARANLASAKSVLAVRLRDHDKTLRALEVLLGEYPAAKMTVAHVLPDIQKRIPAGLPAELLSRRPDIVAAGQKLRSAGERFEVARKNWLPSIRITASGGVATDEFRNLLDWKNLVWNFLAGITQPVFQGGRLSAERALAQADRSEALASYAQTVLNAFREVETALAAELRYTEQETALKNSAKEAHEAAKISFEHYQEGLVNITTLLDAQRRAYNAKSSSIRAKLDQLNNRIILYLALGGDFSDPLKTASIESSTISEAR